MSECKECKCDYGELTDDGLCADCDIWLNGEPPKPEPKAFESWKAGGIRFLAVPQNSNVSIIDEYGRNWGAWFSVADFRKRLTAGDELVKPYSRKGYVQVQFQNCPTVEERRA